MRFLGNRNSIININIFIKILYILRYYIKKNPPISHNIYLSTPKYLLNYNTIDVDSNIYQIKYIMTSDLYTDNIIYTKYDKKALIDTIICVQLEYNHNRSVLDFCIEISNKCFNYSLYQDTEKIKKYINNKRPLREILNLFSINDLLCYGI